MHSSRLTASHILLPLPHDHPNLFANAPFVVIACMYQQPLSVERPYFLIIELCSDQTKSDKPTTVRFYLLSLLPQCKLRFHLWTCDGIMAEFCHKVQLSFAASTLARQDSTNE